MYNPNSTDPECKDIIRPGMCAPKQMLPAVRRRIRERYPMPDKRYLRRSQQPIYISLLQELLEDDFPETADFLSRLIELEKALQSNLIEGMKLKSLYEAPKLLEDLLACFKLTERMDSSKYKKLYLSRMLCLFYNSNRISKNCGWSGIGHG